ncbi:protein quick-to-court-like isoform X2 [Artemia franciscana]|uniref:Uncharacterized protein n=1 Tax=Artemia franciscana TaxID=6661 RepID=A0AA88LJQ9_ARTSF|nr:hypothetical protein QYM36_000707 [Artemia franciscana]
MEQSKEDTLRKSKIPVPRITRSASFACDTRLHSTPKQNEKQQRSSVPAMGNSSEMKKSDDVCHSYLSKWTKEDYDDSRSVCSSTISRKSSNRLKYTVHCQDHHEKVEEYLTPTQRANRTIRRLRIALQEAMVEIRQKDSEIQRLTKELVEVRLSRIPSPPDTLVRSDSSPEIVRNLEAVTSKSLNSFDSRHPNMGNCSHPLSLPGRFDDHQPPSLTDSGHYDDITSPVYHSKESLLIHHLGGIREESLNLDWPQRALNDYSFGDCSSDWRNSGSVVEEEVPENNRNLKDETVKLLKATENKIENMKRNHVAEIQKIKEKYNERLENVLHQLTEANSRYCLVLPEVESTRQRLHSAESEIDRMKFELSSKEKQIDGLTKKLDLLQECTYTNSGQQEEKDSILEAYEREIATLRVETAEKSNNIQVLKNEVDALKKELSKNNSDYSNPLSKPPASQFEGDLSFKVTSNPRNPIRNLLSGSEAITLWKLSRLKNVNWMDKGHQ